MEFEKVLKNRVSTRRYLDKMPSEEDIRSILDAALLGPVERHKIHITVVTNKKSMEMRKKRQKRSSVLPCPGPIFMELPCGL